MDEMWKWGNEMNWLHYLGVGVVLGHESGFLGSSVLKLEIEISCVRLPRVVRKKVGLK